MCWFTDDCLRFMNFWMRFRWEFYSVAIESQNEQVLCHTRTTVSVDVEDALKWRECNKKSLFENYSWSTSVSLRHCSIRSGCGMALEVSQELRHQYGGIFTRGKWFDCASANDFTPWHFSYSMVLLATLLLPICFANNLSWDLRSESSPKFNFEVF